MSFKVIPGGRTRDLDDTDKWLLRTRTRLYVVGTVQPPTVRKKREAQKALNETVIMARKLRKQIEDKINANFEKEET